MFYVLTEAGEYGETGGDKDKVDAAAFMTEVESPRTTNPDYVKHVTVKISLINDVKKG